MNKRNITNDTFKPKLRRIEQEDGTPRENNNHYFPDMYFLISLDDIPVEYTYEKNGIQINYIDGEQFKIPKITPKIVNDQLIYLPSVNDIRKKFDLPDNINIYFKHDDDTYKTINDNDTLPEYNNEIHVRIGVDNPIKYLSFYCR